MRVRFAFRWFALQFLARRNLLIIPGSSIFIILFVLVASLPLCAAAQQSPLSDQSAQEIVANLCAGRVVIGVAKDGIVVATLENPIEPQTRPPMIVSISDQRAAVLLGAADWWLPDQNRELARLDQELPTLPPPHGMDANRPHLQSGYEEGAGSEATGIENLADNLRARLATIANHIHGNLNLAADQPLLQMILADYAPDYGPEVWLVQYFVEQEPEQGDYWQTRILQPKYDQLWPPEKGQPRGLVEVSDPVVTPIASLIRSGDSRLAQAIAAAPGMTQISAAILNGDVQKVDAANLAAFFRTCLGALAASKARMVEAEINKVRGIGWFIQPPVEPQVAGSEQLRPAGAPSLHRATKPNGPGRY